jgi:hypothetical protein
MRSSLLWMTLAMTAAAYGQPGVLPPGVHQKSDEPLSNEVLDAGKVLAAAYVRALREHVEFDNITQIDLVERTLRDIVRENARFEADTRPARRKYANEIMRLESLSESATPYGRSRLDFLFGQYEQILHNAPLEPMFVLPRIETYIPLGQEDVAVRALVEGRGAYGPLSGPVRMSDVAPGTPTTWRAFALVRYRTAAKVGSLRSAAEIPVHLSAPDAVDIILPRYYSPAPPLDEWSAYLELSAKRYGFDETQRRSGEIILKDIENRAQDLRRAFSRTYESVGALEDAEQRASQMWILNRPIDAMFDELRQRLCGLATVEQRAAAAAKMGDAITKAE